MKKYTLDELEEAESILAQSIAALCNPVLGDVIKDIQANLKSMKTPKFVKATDKELDELYVCDVYSRLMEPTDEFYIKGYYGLFLISNDKLLRRHSDRGWLRYPQYHNQPNP